ncbi:MAG: site-specific integrase [Bacteroidales bacterium]|nr:site-specific integrase [Bacteroidales bacterium]
MKVTLRKRERKDKISLYLDFYDKKTRRSEYLDLYLILKPKNKTEREQNRKTLECAEAIRARRQIEFQNNKMGLIDRTAADKSFLDYFESLAKKRKASEGNYGNWMSALKHLKNFTNSGIKVSQINEEWLGDFKNYLLTEVKTKDDKRLSVNSAASYFSKVLAVLKQASKVNIIDENIWKDVKRIEEMEVEREFLTLEELKEVADKDCENPLLKRAFLFSALTGLRFSDIENLRWKQVQHSDETGYSINFRQVKTQKLVTLYISGEAFNLLGERRSGPSKVFQDLVYSDYNNQKLKDWIKSAGIEKKITFHSARHTFATLQLTLGTDIYTVSNLLGHKSLKTTEIYAKIIDKRKIEAANRIKLK